MPRLWWCAALLLTPAPLLAQGWDPGEPTASRVRGQISEPRDGRGDGVHGRFAGDFDLGFGLGLGTTQDDALGAARLSLHYYSTLGVYAVYADGLGQEGEIRRFGSIGAELRPLFLPRWSQDLEQGPATLDLAIDSLSLGMGAFFAQPRGRDFGSERGLELSLGAGLPFFQNASGPWLEARYVYRWLDPGGADERDHAVLVVLSWHSVLLSGLAE